MSYPIAGAPPSTQTEIGKALVEAETAQAAQQAIDLEPGVDIQAFMPTASQAEMEAGTETALRATSPLLVKKSINALANRPVLLFEVKGDNATRQTLASNVEVTVIGGAGGPLNLASTPIQSTWDASTGIFTYTGTRTVTALIIYKCVYDTITGRLERLDLASSNVTGSGVGAGALRSMNLLAPSGTALSVHNSTAGAASRVVELTTGATVRLLARAIFVDTGSGATCSVAPWGPNVGFSVIALDYQ